MEAKEERRGRRTAWRESPSERQTRKQERKGQERREKKREATVLVVFMACDLQVHFFLRFSFLPFPSPTTISLPLFLLRFSSSSSTHGGTYIRVLRLLRSLLLSFSCLPLSRLSCFSLFLLLFTFTSSAVARSCVYLSILLSNLRFAFSGHVAHAARKRGGDATRHDAGTRRWCWCWRCR